MSSLHPSTLEMFLFSCFNGFSVKSYAILWAYNSTVQEFCAVRYVKAFMGSIASAQIDLRAQNKNGVQQGGSTVGMALNCAFIKIFWSKALHRPKRS